MPTTIAPTPEPLIKRCLHALATEIGPRPTGSAANRRAQAYITSMLAETGCSVEEQTFDCLDWQCRGVSLRCGGYRLAVQANPFTPPCDVSVPFVVAATLTDLEQADLTGKMIVLTGDLSVEALFPKNFPFFQLEHHQRIIQQLEAGQPAAVIMVSHRDEQVAPLIEDGDLAIPSATVSARVGDLLLTCFGEQLCLRIDSELGSVRGANVIGRRPGRSANRIVVCAHFDTKPGTPGALDNAAGVAALLGLSQMTAGWQGELGLDFIAFNGEDNYASPGQVTYLQQHGATLGDVVLCINIDGVGWRETRNTVASFTLPAPMADALIALLPTHPDIVEAEPWPQGDHMVFAMQGVPALALTSEGIYSLIDCVIHTADDTVELISAASIADVVTFLDALVRRVDNVSI